MTDEQTYADRAAFLLSQVGAHTKRAFVAALAPLDLHPGHYKALEELDRSDGATQQEIADRLGVHRGVMVGLIDDLEARRLVERRRHPTDRRANALHLTASGRRQLGRARRVAERLDAEMLTPLDPGERERLRGLLRRVADSAGLTVGLHPDLAGGACEPRATTALPRTSERNA